MVQLKKTKEDTKKLKEKTETKLELAELKEISGDVKGRGLR